MSTVAGIGHDRRQRPYLLAVLERHRLGDHATHRDPEHVRRLDRQGVEQTSGVSGHVGEAIAGLHRPVGHETRDNLPPRRDRPVERRAQTDVAVVEAKDTETPVDQFGHEPFRPVGHLARQAHHQQQRLTGTS